MSRLLTCLLLFGTALTMPVAASAQDSKGVQRGDDGWYASAAATLSFLNDTAGTIANAPVPGSTVRIENPLKAGYGLQAALGRSFGPIRLEGEVGYSRNKQDRYVSIVPPTGSIHADVKDDALRWMVNGYYDFSLMGVQSYLGAGLGVARIDIDFFAPRAPFSAEAPRQLIKDSDSRFSYQLMGGIAFPLSDDVALTLQYRWFDAGTINAKDVRGQAITRDHAGHNLDVGVRIRL